MPNAKRTLLCIDNDQELLDSYRGLLEDSGFKVFTAISGRQGLDLAASHTIDLVILDYQMPEMNGEEVAIEMRRLRPRAIIILCSGAVDVPEAALKLVDTFVSKGRGSSFLLPRISELLASR
jgi:DNA-binding response OmpR family regulator